MVVVMVATDTTLSTVASLVSLIFLLLTVCLSMDFGGVIIDGRLEAWQKSPRSSMYLH